MKSKENEFEIISITFKDFKGNEHILTEQTQELWKKAFNLRNIEEIFVPNLPTNLLKVLGKNIQLKKGSLFKIVSQGREQFIPLIKEVLESPDFALNDGNLILARHLKDDDYFVNVSFDAGDCFVSISNGIKETRNIENKLKNGAKIIYQSPNANSISHTLLQVSQYSTNETDKSNIPNPTLKNTESPNIQSFLGIDYGNINKHTQDKFAHIEQKTNENLAQVSSLDNLAMSKLIEQSEKDLNLASEKENKEVKDYTKNKHQNINKNCKG